MRRPTLTVKTSMNHNEQNTEYELSQVASQVRASCDSQCTSMAASPTKPKAPEIVRSTQDNESAGVVDSTYVSPKPSFWLLFSFLSRRDFITLVFPAVCFSLISGVVAPFMTLVVGSVFDAFARFSLSSPTQEQKSELLRSIGLASLELLALGVGAIALGSVTSAMWITAGERNVMRIRMAVYSSVSGREMDWFDTKMGTDDSGLITDSSAERDGAIGAGGLMAKFNRDTDDVRMASSLAVGMLLQYATTCIACLVIAFIRSWSLTLVILAAVPALVVIQAFSQHFIGPLIASERTHTAQAATVISRAISSISTVKAFNAQALELLSLTQVVDRLHSITVKQNGVWAVTSGFSQFVSMAMFVQGFWFGARLVRSGKVSEGDVMAVFWACLIAASNLQLCIPQFITLSKGKFAVVALVTLIDPQPTLDFSGEVVSRNSIHPLNFHASPPLSTVRLNPKFNFTARQRHTLRKIQPTRCSGELALEHVSFAYPSRPAQYVLIDVSMYFPAGEMTFVVGGSGSGKSTVAQLLTRIYSPQYLTNPSAKHPFSPISSVSSDSTEKGIITLDEQDTSFLDEHWLRSHVALVSQNCILFDGTVHDNVALGVAGLKRRPEEVSREEVVKVCIAAMMHEFIMDLPDGYDTRLSGSGGGTGDKGTLGGGGGEGVSLSGGQKQRLAIARAMLRDPTVLVLDEATSALDATSRVLVFEAIKTWRRNKTTIVITHDLSQITAADFVYVLKDGQVVEQGYRPDLEVPVTASPRQSFFSKDREESGFSYEGEFLKMMHAQTAQGGFPAKRDSQIDVPDADIEGLLERSDAEHTDLEANIQRRLSVMGIQPYSPPQRNNTVKFSNWMLDVVADLTTVRTAGEIKEMVPQGSNGDEDELDGIGSKLKRSMSTKRVSIDDSTKRAKYGSFAMRKHLSLQFIPSSPRPTSIPSSQSIRTDVDTSHKRRFMEDTEIEIEPWRIDQAKESQKDVTLKSITVDIPSGASKSAAFESPSFFRLLHSLVPTVTNKPVIILGLFVAVLSGAMTPIFSFVLSRLLFEVSIGAQNLYIIDVFGGIVLAMAAMDGILLGTKYFILETGSSTWVTRLRKLCYERLLAQDKSFFDRSDGIGSATKVVQTLVKDGDDARNLLSVVLGQCIVVVTMLSVGLLWALIRGWQLTLAGFAIGPVFALVMSLLANGTAKVERRNKLAREEIARGYYECISNIRAIRCMSFEKVFQEKYENAVTRAYNHGVRGAFVEGCSFGVANGMIYLSEAFLFYIGAVLVSKEIYTYLQMVEVLNLVVFTVTIGSQLMSFTQKVAKASEAARELKKILDLSTDTEEFNGSIQPILLDDIKFSDVSFSYPERAEVPVLQSISLRLRRNECVAIVGASGSGKSTIAALLQKLYKPTSGQITIGNFGLSFINTKYLRDNIAIVSQNPALFDDTITNNISYGNPNSNLTLPDIKNASQRANCNSFIESLPEGYETHIGENASQISGGQAQRIAIARAFARKAHILILDECTSALDVHSQRSVMESITSKDAADACTTVVITHKLPVMQLCDRIIVLQDGRVAEEGTYDELVTRNGVFAALARGGEWVGES